jgi:hypothetical protein
MLLLARKRRGQCLSTLYVNSTTPLVWQCAAGHRWSAIPASVRKGSWCPECAGVKRITLDEMQEIAAARGGSCLSEVCPNGATKLHWRCKEAHEWSATPSQIRHGHWCPFCARTVPLSLCVLRQMAGSRGGECLSNKSVRSSESALWKCASGHVWQARVSSVRAGQWCPVCAHNQKLGLDQMQQIARERGGQCLSTRYKNGCTPLLWECCNGHRWRASPANVKGGMRKKGTWCPECYNARRTFHEKHSIERMREIALLRQGRCVSTGYVGSKSKLTWKCALEHRWQALPASVLQGTWCPVCARNQRLHLSDLQNIAASRGGICVSPHYVNERTILSWQCSAGHRWNATPAKVKRGSWCPTCARIRRRSQWIALGTNHSKDRATIYPRRGHPNSYRAVGNPQSESTPEVV